MFHGVPPLQSALTGQMVDLASSWERALAIVVIVRRFGCPLCHHQAIQVLSARQQLVLQNKNVNLVAVGAGGKDQAEVFIRSTGWPGEVYLDKDYATHKAIGAQRWTAGQALRRFFSVSALKFMKQLMKQYKDSNMKGDGMQSGGVVIMAPGQAQPVFLWRGSDHAYNEFVQPSEISSVVGKTKVPRTYSGISHAASAAPASKPVARLQPPAMSAMRTGTEWNAGGRSYSSTASDPGAAALILGDATVPKCTADLCGRKPN